MIVLPIVERLPQAYLEAIGLFMTTWARLEHELRDLTFYVLDVDPKRGRTAIRTPRPKEMVEMVEELLLLDGIREIKQIDMAALKSMMDEIEFRRNVFAHNIWLLAPDGKFAVQNFRGSWPAANGVKVRKRMLPEGKATELDDLTHVVDKTLELIGAVRAIRQEIAPQLAASPQRRRAPPPA